MGNRTPKKPMGRGKKIMLWAGGVLVAIIALLTAIGISNPMPVADPKPSPTVQTVEKETTPTPEPEPTPTASQPTEEDRLIEAANQWWFEDGGSNLSRYITTLEAFMEAAEAGDSTELLSACSQMQTFTEFLGDWSINSVSRPTDFGDEVAETFDWSTQSLRDAADGCKAVFDEGEMTRAEQAGLDATMALSGLSIVKDDVYGKYIEQ